MNKSYFQRLFGHASSLHQQGDITGAQIAYRQILKDFPRNPDVLHLLGLTYAKQNRLDEAIDWIKNAIIERPGIAAFHNNLGEAYYRQEKLNDALIHYEQSTKIEPRFVQGYFGQANTHKKLGNYQQAIELYQKTIEIESEFFQAYYNLGNTEQELGNYKSAMSYYEKCLIIYDKHELAHNNMGIMLQHWDKYDAAIDHYKKAIEINPNFKNGYTNLAKIYEKQADIESAKKYYLNLSSLEPDDAIVKLKIQTLSPVVFESNESIDDYHKKINQAIDQYDLLPFNPTKLDDSCYNIFPDLIYQGRMILDFKRKYAQKFLSAMPVIPNRKPNAVPHIGFVVTEGHEGVFIKCMRGIINQMDTNKFKITIVCSQPNGKRIIQPTIENFEVGFLELPKRIEHASQLILNTKFDVLNYWEIGTDTTNYFLPFLRLAPVQCTSWGWPITSGIPNVDYFISARYLEVPEADEYYSEKLVRLNHIPVFYYHPPVPDVPKPLQEYELSEDCNYYFCTQNLKKVHPDFDVIVEGILSQDPNGVVLFIKDKQPNVTRLLQERLERVCSKQKNRIKFLARMSENDYLGLLLQIDVALDTLHYGGGANTCYDAFACGTPVITLPGQLHRSRYAYAAYKQMDLEDCICSDTSNYITRAVKIATDTELRSIISNRIKGNVNLLLNDHFAVEELSAFYERIYTSKLV